ncbi:hypothetical protein SLNHY_5796 [Streptomyces albus]|nr:hypothetical protein SLNHY_5796 [Streptomyces albus]
MAAGTGGQLRSAARQLGRAAHLLLLVRRDRLRSGYGGGHRGAGPLLGLLLAHLLLLLVLGGSTGRRGEFRPQVLVLAEQAVQLCFDLVEEGIDLVLVIAFSEADGRELLVPHVLGGQRHLFTSTGFHRRSASGKTVSGSSPLNWGIASFTSPSRQG